MKCYDDGELLAYLDGEVTAETRAAMTAHVRDCEECRGTVARLAQECGVAADALERLQPRAEVVTLAAEAVRPQPRFGWGRIAAAAAAVLVLASFTLAPVRTAAADLLRVFRIQKVQTISLSQDDLQQIGDTLSKGTGHIDLKSMGEAWVDGTPGKASAVTLAEAQKAVDFPVTLPQGVNGTPEITLAPAKTYRFKLKVAAINDALRYYGSERTLPDSVDGKVFSVQVPAIVLARYEVGSNPAATGKARLMQGVSVGQGRSPQLVVPEGVDAAQLRDVLLNLPFLPKNVRDQLAAVNDWQSTLLVPDVGGSSHNVTIDGVPAVVIGRPQMVNPKSLGTQKVPQYETIVWNDNGVVRALGGPMDEAAATRLVKSMMR
jgi:hypothetical protein